MRETNVASQARDSGLEAVAATLSRVIALARAETDRLACGAPVDWQEFVDGKSRLLLEFSRVQRAFVGEPDARLLALARELRDVLRTNRNAVSLQVQASQRIVGMLASAASAVDSDGTYSQTRRGR